MLSRVLDPTSYALSLAALPVLVVGIMVAGLGLTAFVRERGSPISIAFAALTSIAAFWLLSFVAIYSTPVEPVARWWVNVGQFGVIFLPSAILIVSLAIVQQFRQHRTWVWSSLALSAIFYLCIIMTDQFVIGVRHYSWGYYPQYGLLSIPYLAFFLAAVAGSLRQYWIASRSSSAGSPQRARLNALMVAFAVGYLGSVDFLAAYGLPIYPFGFVLVCLFAVLSARAIQRYRLYDITPAFAVNHILAIMADALLVFDREGIVRVVNQAACALFGRTEAELVGIPIATVDRQILSPEQTEELLRNDDVYNYEIRRPSAKGEIRTLSVYASLMRDQTSQPVAIVSIARDVTRRKLAEEQVRALNQELEQRVIERTGQLQAAINNLEEQIAERKRAENERLRLAALIERERATLAAVMASMSDGLLVLDAAHQIRYCNPRAGEYLGIDPAPIVHQDIQTVISRISSAEAEPDAMRATWQRLLFHPDGAAGVEIGVSGPPRRTLLVSVFSVADADGASLGLLLQDVTGTKALALLQERERIAMDLHDGVIQSLYGVVLGLGVHERMLGWKIEETRQVLQQTRVQIRDIIHEIRSDVFGLRRQRSRYSTLQAGLKALAAEVSIAAVIRVTLDFDAEADFLLDSVSSDSILRVAREATSNVIRHAQASELTIRLTRADQKLILTVRDNGVGFDPDAADRSVSNPSSGQGLHNMAERALMLGGKLIVRSAPGRGTEIYLKVPM